VVTRDEVRHQAVELDRSALGRRVRKFAFHLASAAASPQAATDAGELESVRENLASIRRMLLDPLALPTARRLVVAPDRQLHAVPFHALLEGASDDRAPLVVYAPSALVHARCVRRPERPAGPAHVIALPDETVPEIRTEAEVVARCSGADTVVR